MVSGCICVPRSELTTPSHWSFCSLSLCEDFDHISDAFKTRSASQLLRRRICIPSTSFMSYWPFSLDSQVEQRQEDTQEQQQRPSPRNTRSSGLPLHPPLGKGRATSPAARAVSPGRQVFFPPNLVVDPPSPSNFEDEDSNMAASQSELDRLQQVAESAIAAATAAARALEAAQNRNKKPDLPPFDRKNVDLWIKRVENAYVRSNVTQPRDKFAYLEPKFTVDFNTKVNDYLFGEQTEARWVEFLQYLRDEYGRSVRQQTATLLAAHPRSGLRPTQFLVNLKDKTKRVTMDTIYREIFFKSLPPDVLHSLVDKIDDWTAEETAKACDKYFDNEGRPLSASTPPSVNAVDEPLHPESSPFTSPFPASEEDVNAVPFRRFSKDNKFGGNRFSSHSSTSFKPKSFSNTSSGGQQSSRRDGNPIRANGLCFVHDKHGDKANLCFPGCSRFSSHKGQKATQGNATASRRT